MDWLLIRHGPAVNREAWTIDDAARPLTPDGRDRVAKAGAGLRALGLSAPRVLHSPWIRAVETATLLAPLLEGVTEPCDALALSPDVETTAGLLAQAGNNGAVALVGHEPFLSELLTVLLLGHAQARAADSPLPVDWKKCGVAWLASQRPAPGRFILRAFLPPALLRQRGSRKDG